MRLESSALVGLSVLLSACATQGAGAPAASASRAAAPLPCNSDTLHVATPAGPLEGSFLCPATPAPWPAVLLIAGSGPTDRNGNTAGLAGPNNSLQLLAEALAQRGIASVRYDKRGVGGSRAALTSEAELRFDMLADDAAAWVRRMRLDPRLSTITVVGHSEGSLLGMLATRSANADAFVSLEGAGRSASAVLHEQLTARAPAPLAAQADSIMAALDAGRTVDSVPPALMAIFRPSVQPYLVSWFRHDPAKELATLAVPVLIVQGTTDIQVSQEDARLLAAADSRARLVTIDGMNHVLKLVPADMTQQMKSYGDPSLPVAPALVDAVASFVKEVRPR
jgi:pimeloyl-ACP methyl ester carboxylesterase